MSVRSGQAVTTVFTTASFSTGALASADSLPTGILYLNGVANGASVVVTNVTTGLYKAAVTLPTLAVNDIVSIVVLATVGGVAGGGKVWEDTKDVFTGAIPDQTAGASGGLFIAGTNDHLTVTNDLTISGNYLVTGTTTHAGAMAANGGVTFTSSTGSGFTCQSTGGNGHGLKIAGNGTGDGLTATGGATGNGLRGVGGTSSGAGARIEANSTTGNGASVFGGGTGHGIQAIGGSTGGSGAVLTGGVASTSTPAGHGLLLAGGNSTTVSGGVAGAGISSTGGAGAASTNGAGSGAIFTGGGTTTVSGGDGVQMVHTGSVADLLCSLVAANFGAASLNGKGDWNTTTPPTAAAIATGVWQDTTPGDFSVASSVGKSLYTGNNSPGSASGLALVGSNVGAATSVSGSVGSVAGNVAGNVQGSVAAVAAGGITNASFAADTGLQTVRSGTAQATGNDGTHVKLDAGASATANFYLNCLLYLTGGAGQGEARFITAYDGSTKIATLNSTIPAVADGTSTFAILPFDTIVGATAPTAAQNATAVWQDALAGSDFSGAGSIGALLKANVNAPIGSVPTAPQIATAVWQDTTSSDFSVATSPGKVIFTQLGGVFTTSASSIFSVASLANAPTGGNPPTAAQVASAVWQDVTGGDFTVLGSIGRSLFTGGNVPGAASGLALVGSNMGTVALSPSGLDAVTVEAGLNARQALSIIAASAAGVLAGAATPAVVIAGAGVGTTRISATTTVDGNRTSVSLSPPA